MKQMGAFKDKIKALGGEVLAPTNPYEKLRFRTKYGVGVVYTSKGGARETWNAEAILAREHIEKQNGFFGPVKKTTRRRSSRAKILAIAERDGEDCFFCGIPLGDDVTIEHLVPVAHGGPNHISNLFLAHDECNRAAGHLSAPEKVQIAISKRKALP